MRGVWLQLNDTWPERTSSCPLGVPCHSRSFFHWALQVDTPIAARFVRRPGDGSRFSTIL